eukprot:319703_1
MNGYVSFFFMLYILVFVFIVELIRRFRVAEIFWVCIMPFVVIILMVVWDEDHTIFLWAKLCSVIISCWVVQIIRYRLQSWKEKKKNILSSLLLWVTYSVPAINIFEAVVTEFVLLRNFGQGIFIGNVINGIMLLLTQANPRKITISVNG